MDNCVVVPYYPKQARCYTKRKIKCFPFFMYVCTYKAKLGKYYFFFNFHTGYI